MYLIDIMIVASDGFAPYIVHVLCSIQIFRNNTSLMQNVKRGIWYLRLSFVLFFATNAKSGSKFVAALSQKFFLGEQNWIRSCTKIHLMFVLISFAGKCFLAIFFMKTRINCFPHQCHMFVSHCFSLLNDNFTFLISCQKKTLPHSVLCSYWMFLLIDGVRSGPLIFEADEETHFTLVLEADERLIWISKVAWAYI